MKKILFIAAIILTITGCRDSKKKPINNDNLAAISETVADMPVSMIVIPYRHTSTPKQLSFSITNNTTEQIQFGAEYGIEKYFNDQWLNQELVDIPVISIMHILDPGQSDSYKIHVHPDFLYGTGKYRLRKNILMENDSFPVFAEFIITE